MRAWLHAGLVALLIGAAATACLAQSLEEAAKQERERKSKIQHPAPVYTNENLPKHYPEIPRLPERAPAPRAQAAAEPEAQPPTALEVRAKIREQKLKVMALEGQVGRLQRQLDSTMYLMGAYVVEGNPSIIVTNPASGLCAVSAATYYHPYQQWCDEPARLSAEIDKTMEQLQQERATLEEMQEQARRMGFRSAVYDP